MVFAVNTLGSEATSNVIYNGLSALGGKVTTGKDNLLFIDISAAVDQIQDSTGSSLKVRVDIARLNPATGIENVRSITSPCVYLNDVSFVDGDLASNPTNYGRRLAGHENIPMLFRTLCGDGITTALSRGIRVTLASPEIVNGDKVSVYLANLAPAANFSITDASIAFDSRSSTAPRALVNGGPLGGDNAIAPYSAVMVRNTTTATSGDIKIYTDVPLFEQGGAGIDLSGVVFKIRDVASTTESFKTVSKPANVPERNAQGKYEYFVGT